MPFSPALGEEIYQKPTDFLIEAFQGPPPPVQILTVVGELREKARQILDHNPPSLRTRYWTKGERTVWILEEIGKVLPITTRIIIQGGLIEDVRILIYRESHGSEVRHRFFTNQFKDAQLTQKSSLSRAVDGISGATLSVHAIKRLATLALLYDQEIRHIQ